MLFINDASMSLSYLRLRIMLMTNERSFGDMPHSIAMSVIATGRARQTARCSAMPAAWLRKSRHSSVATAVMNVAGSMSDLIYRCMENGV